MSAFGKSVDVMRLYLASPTNMGAVADMPKKVRIEVNGLRLVQSQVLLGFPLAF